MGRRARRRLRQAGTPAAKDVWSGMVEAPPAPQTPARRASLGGSTTRNPGLAPRPGALRIPRRGRARLVPNTPKRVKALPVTSAHPDAICIDCDAPLDGVGYERELAPNVVELVCRTCAGDGKAALFGADNPAWRGGVSSETRRLWRGLSFGEMGEAGVAEIERDPAAWAREHVLQGEQLGIHWTDSPSSAWNFSQDRDPEGWVHEDGGWDDEDDGEPTYTVGVVLEAEVASEHVLEPGTPEWEDWAMGSAILDPDHPEQEVTVRSPEQVERVHVLVTIVDQDGVERELDAGTIERPAAKAALFGADNPAWRGGRSSGGSAREDVHAWLAGRLYQLGPDGKPVKIEGLAERAEQAVRAAYEGTFKGLRTEVTGLDTTNYHPATSESLDHRSIHVRGVVVDAEGARVGNFERVVDVIGGKAEHRHLYLDRSVQGRDFATEFNAQVEAFYRDVGVNEIRLNANSDVGGYAWAKEGFDWEDGRVPKGIRARLEDALNEGWVTTPTAAFADTNRSRVDLTDTERDQLQALADRASSRRASEHPTPLEVASVGSDNPRIDTDGREWWPGKAVLMGSQWNARKDLYPQ